VSGRSVSFESTSQTGRWPVILRSSKDQCIKIFALNKFRSAIPTRGLYIFSLGKAPVIVF